MEFYGDSYKGNDEPIFVGIPTFLKLPWLRSHEELKKVKPDVAIIGEPFDFGTTIRPGARYGPRAIRAASTVPSPPYEHFNIETGETLADVRSDIIFIDIVNPTVPGHLGCTM